MPQPKKILCIDDEPDIGEIVKEFFETYGFTTFATTSATQGLEIVRRENPDVILLDVIMPEMSGLECLEQILQIKRDAVVIVVSGVQDEHIAKKAIEQGAYDYLTKPFNLEAMRSQFMDRLFAE